MDDKVCSPAIICPPGFPSQLEWEITNHPNGTVRLKLPGKSLYLSNLGDDDEVHYGHPVRLEETETPWRLLPTGDENVFTIHNGDSPLVLDIGQVGIFPPQLNLMPITDDKLQAWLFYRIE
ncbi:hypothetical protein BGZ51_008445 [Haplosporangium sp. Z 767]|nr:hypothetical protein BGZ51_008445 [Haplosporangium sp. Z 767]